MLGFENSIEPAEVAPQTTTRKPFWRTEPSPDEMPIREATKAETRRLSSQSAPHEGERDAVAQRYNLYTEDRRSTRVYYSDYQQKSEVMRATAKEITTKQDDRQTVSMMLDLAQSRGWQTLKLNGTDSFKREAFIEAQARGITTEGYRPTMTDMQEAERRKAAVAPVDQPIRVAAKAPQRAESTAAKPAAAPRQRQAQKQAKPAPNGRQPDGFWDAQRAQIDPDQAAQSREVKSSSGIRM